MQPNPAATTYEIEDGVRRTRALYEAGETTVEAEIQGQPGVVVTLPIASLRSPHKSEIDTTLPGGLKRWENVQRAAASRVRLPPILVRVGSRGIPVDQIVVV